MNVRPSSIQTSIAFQTNKTPAEYAALAHLVDGYGFDVVSVYNDLLFQPALGPLLWMAPHLSRATLGPAALLDLATEGRAYLGLARGAWLDALGLDQPRPVATLREAMQVVRHVLA